MSSNKCLPLEIKHHSLYLKKKIAAGIENALGGSVIKNLSPPSKKTLTLSSGLFCVDFTLHVCSSLLSFLQVLQFPPT